jgi:two-component system cell cycle response regulator
MMAMDPTAIPSDDGNNLHQPKEPLRCTVLVVDDDALVRAKLSELLRRAGYEVAAAASGEQGLQILSSLDCRIVVADWQMPGMDGLALCRYVRLKHSVNYIYFLMLTVRGNRRDVLRGLAAGADDYLIKGAPMEEILARLEVGRRLTQLEHSIRISDQINPRSGETDPLTGVFNRRYLSEYLPREIERSKHDDRPLAVLSCAIDAFKQINDTFGHCAGDEVVQWFAGCASRSIREASDWVARIGEDEFVVILPRTNLEQSAVMARKLQQTFVERPIITGAGALNCTVSIGSAALQTAHELATTSAIELLRAADLGQYANKRGGRERTIAMSAGGAGRQSPGFCYRAKNALN